MKLQYCSDLHLEFRENSEFLKKHPLQVIGDILLLAGDIVPFAVKDRHNDFFDFVARNFQYTYWIPGNHEYYHYDIALRSGVLHEAIRGNVFLVNNVAVEHGPVRLICSTMWSEIRPLRELEIENSINDFHLIRHNGRRFTSHEFNQLHHDSMNFLRQEIAAKSDRSKVVMTHHVPTYMNFPEQYKGSSLSEVFAVELFDLIEPSDVHSWLYGHHHCNTPDFKIGNTALVTNQLGNVGCGEHKLFRTDKVMEIPG